MVLHQEITDLRKSGRLDEAYTRGKELLTEYPEDAYIRSSFGWVLYEKLKKLVEIANQSQSMRKDTAANQIKEILVEYYRLNLDRPDLLFSLLLSQTLRFSGELRFLPKFMMWAEIHSFRAEDLQTQTGNDGKVFESLVERAARITAKISRDLTLQDHSDESELKKVKDFSITLIEFALEQSEVQKSEWLHYYKALILHQLGRSEDSQKLLTSFVQQKRSDYWAWHALRVSSK